MNIRGLNYLYRISGAVALVFWLILAVVSQRGQIDNLVFVSLSAVAGLAVLAALYSKLRLMNVPSVKILGLVIIWVVGLSIAAGSIFMDK